MIAAALAWVGGFGYVSAKIASRLDRSASTWFAFGAVLGPVAVVLLHAAPPGLCRSCWRPTQGWLSECVWCHADVWVTPPQTVELVNRLTAGVGAGGAPPTRAPAPPTADGPREQPMKLTTGVAPPPRRGSKRWPSPDSDVATPVEAATPRLPSWRPRTTPAESSRATTNGSPHAGPRTAPVIRETISINGRPKPPALPPAIQKMPVSVTRSPAPESAIGPTEPSSINLPQPSIAATGVYISGTSSMQPGRRYGITIDGGRIRFSGPLDGDPNAVVLERAVSDADATSVDGRFIYSEPANRSSMVLAFMSVAGLTAEGLAEAVGTAARAARS